MTNENKLSIYQIISKMQNELIAPKTNQCQGKFMYRTCEDILNGLKLLLAKYNCSLIMNDKIIQVGNDIFVESTVILIDCEGNKIESTASAKHPEKLMAMSASQITGSTSSYARKSALSGLLCLDDSQDADVVERDKKASGIISASERQKLSNLVRSMGYGHNVVLDYLLSVHGFNNPDEITSEKIKEIMECITKGNIEQETKEAQDDNS